MEKEMRFFIYLLENYADSKGMSGRQVLKVWEELDIINLIYDMYEIYHIEQLQNAFDDIDDLIIRNQWRRSNC